MKSTKIDWCDCTINPVVGCPNGCKYCYARRINERFHFVDNWEQPQFFSDKLIQIRSKQGKSIFMDSMSDISCWTREWAYAVMREIAQNPQHNYIFLTKGGGGLEGAGTIWSQREINGDWNVFIGKTVDKQSRFNLAEHYDFLSIEPLLEPIDLSAVEYSLYTKAVIIGAETGNRKGKIIPQKSWIEDIVACCDNGNVAVFMKESLRSIMGEDFRQDTLPWEIKKDGGKNDKRK